jgi:hypothetical protein
MDTWTHGHMDTWTHGHMDTWTHGHMDTWTHGHMDKLVEEHIMFVRNILLIADEFPGASQVDLPCYLSSLRHCPCHPKYIR